MQKTRNNCFGSNIRSTTLRQQFIIAMYPTYQRTLLLYFGTCAFLFNLTWVDSGRAAYFRPETIETIVASFLHLMGLLFKVLFNHTLKTPVCDVILIINSLTKFGIHRFGRLQYTLNEEIKKST